MSHKESISWQKLELNSTMEWWIAV